MVLEAITELNAGHNLDRTDNPKTIHIALVVPDVRLYNLVKSKFRIVPPPYDNVRVQLHVLVEDKKDPLRDLDWQIRVALVQSGLVPPQDAHLTYPDQVTLGWPTEG